MNSMGPTGAQKCAPGPIFQDRHSGNIVGNNVRRGGAPFRRLTATDPVCSVCLLLPPDFILAIICLVLGVQCRLVVIVVKGKCTN